MAGLTFAPQITKYQYLKTNLFSGSEQIAYCSETSSDHCQISKMEGFEKVVDGFELFSIFAKRSILDVWQGSEYGSTPDTYPVRGRN